VLAGSKVGTSPHFWRWLHGIDDHGGGIDSETSYAYESLLIGYIIFNYVSYIISKKWLVISWNEASVAVGRSCAAQTTILSIWVSSGGITDSFVSKFYQVSDNLTYQRNIRWKIDLNGELFEFLRWFVDEYFFLWPRRRRWYLRTFILFLSWISTYIIVHNNSQRQAQTVGRSPETKPGATVDSCISHFLPLW